MINNRKYIFNKLFYSKANMKSIILFVTTLTIFGCGSSQGLYSYQPYIVKKIQKNGQFVEEYLIKFHGTEFTSAAEAREAWDFRAKNVCQSDYQYLTFEQFELYKKLQAELFNRIDQCPK